MPSLQSWLQRLADRPVLRDLATVTGLSFERVTVATGHGSLDMYRAVSPRVYPPNAHVLHLGEYASTIYPSEMVAPQFMSYFILNAVHLATKRGVEGGALTIDAPLITMSKAAIIRYGSDLGVDYTLTVSCYQADDQGRACGRCDSCRLRRDGFAAAGVPDPTRYR